LGPAEFSKFLVTGENRFLGFSSAGGLAAGGEGLGRYNPLSPSRVRPCPYVAKRKYPRFSDEIPRVFIHWGFWGA